MGGTSVFNGVWLILEMGKTAPVGLLLGLLYRMVCICKKDPNVLLDALACC